MRLFHITFLRPGAFCLLAPNQTGLLTRPALDIGLREPDTSSDKSLRGGCPCWPVVQFRNASQIVKARYAGNLSASCRVRLATRRTPSKATEA